MTQLFPTRLANYQKKLFRYLKYVFNDHLSLLLLFMLGGFVYYYTELLKQVMGHGLFVKIIVSIVWLASLFVGKLATLIEEADMVFLIPKEEQLASYLKRAFLHSLPLPFLIIIGVVGFAFPMLLVVGDGTVLEAVVFMLTLFWLKILELSAQQTALFQMAPNDSRKLRLYWTALSLGSILLGVFITPWLALGMSIFLGFFLYQDLVKKQRNYLFDWQKSVQLEQNRQKRIYQFINLFTDVPGMTSSVKRRKWLDPLLNRSKKVTGNTYFYLFTRHFLRGTEYSGLFMRLLVIGGLMIAFTHEFYLALPIALVTLFLIAFQLLPLYQQFDYMVMSALYPVVSQQKKQNLQKLMAILLSVVVVGLSLCLFISLDKMSALMASGCLVVFACLLISSYVPLRLKKMKEID